MAKYVCNGHRLDLSLCGIDKLLTHGDVIDLDPVRGDELIANGFPLSPVKEEVVAETSNRETSEKGKE